MSKNTAAAGTFVAPHPGSQQMPQWNTGELIDAPRFTWRNWAAMLGPGLMMGGSAIGGGEWLMGPQITARYGGALLWLATLSILAQVIYNIEISRYTLYTGEPIFTGKFRTKPGPSFWLFIYLFLDIGAVIPYLASTAATPVFMLIWGAVPDTSSTLANKHFLWMDWTDEQLLWSYGCVIFLLAMVPLIFGGKVYNSLRAVMTVKIVTLLGFLLLLGLLYSEPRTWAELAKGFFLVGNVPVNRGEDLNGNGVLDVGEDWDGDGKLDGVEPKFAKVPPTDEAGHNIIWRPAAEGSDLAAFVQISETETRPYLDKEGQQVTRPDNDGDGSPDSFRDLDGDGIRDGDNVDNVFTAVAEGRSLGSIGFDWTVLGLLCAMIAISGQGGLSNTPVSNYTRDQGWGMGHHVGAIPSVIGGHHLELSHVGTVFQPNAETMPRWKRWYKHLLRDQLVVWMPACFIGLALPSMLSAEFLRKGTEAQSWTAAGMTAGAIQDRVADPEEFIATSGSQTGWRAARNSVIRVLATPRIAGFFWFMALFCGLLTLAPTMSSSADGVIRRWVDVFWTASPTLRRLDPRNIRMLYFGVLCGYVVLGLLAITLLDPNKLLRYASQIFNYALGFSCFHALALNLILLPKELRPGWFVRICMVLAGTFFLVVAGLTTYATLR
ncbi:MAG: Nramp family divalent metal transporter [Pirellulales bacterium]